MCLNQKLLLIAVIVQTQLSWANKSKIGVLVSNESEQQLKFGYNLALALQPNNEVVIIQTQVKKSSVTLPEGVREIVFPVKVDSESAWEDICDAVFNSSKFIADVDNEKLEYAIVVDNNMCNFVLLQKVGVLKYSWASSTGLTDVMALAHGIPIASINFEPPKLPKLTYLERAKKLKQIALNYFQLMQHLSKITNLARFVLNPSFPSILSLARKSQFLLVNDFETVIYPTALPSSVIHIGGLELLKETQLEGQVAQFSDLNTQMPGDKVRPLIIVTLKSELSKQKADDFMNFIRANSQADFMWEVDNHTIDTFLPRNLFKSKELPIAKLLAHSRTIAFIFECNWKTVQMAIITASPVICITTAEDQLKNAKLVEFRGIGLTLKITDVTANKLTNVLEKLLNNKDFASSAKTFQKLIQERPFNSQDLLNKWIQYGMHNEVDLAMADVNVIEYYNLDIVVPIGFGILVLTSIVLKFVLGLYYWSCFGMASREKVKLQ